MNDNHGYLNRTACALALLAGLVGCASFGDGQKTRLSDDFSYYQPFDNATPAGGPGYLVGPPPGVGGERQPSALRNPPSSPAPKPDSSLPPSCLSCDFGN